MNMQIVKDIVKKFGKPALGDATVPAKKMGGTKLSVITICYNAKDVEKTCQSIVNQTWQGFEWIVVDGGSEKWCLDILKKYQKQMAHFVSEKDNGIYEAMNKGIGLAKGEYLNFMNAGDRFYDNSVLEKMIKKGVFEEVDIVFGNFKIGHRSKVVKYPSVLPLGWFKDNCLPHQSSFIKKELFDRYGLYNEDNKIVSDWEKWIEFIEVHKCSYRYIDENVSVYNYDGVSGNMSELHRLERMKILKKYYNLEAEVEKPKILKKKIYLFGCLYFLKIRKKDNKTSVYLFGIIPILMIDSKE